MVIVGCHQSHKKEHPVNKKNSQMNPIFFKVKRLLTLMLLIEFEQFRYSNLLRKVLISQKTLIAQFLISK